MKITRPVSDQPIPPHAKTVFQGKIFRVYQWEQKMFDGTTETFEKIGRTDTVNVIPVTCDGRILLTKQEQPGLRAPFWGTPGGRMDDGEKPLVAARRELLEETGYTSNDITLWYALQPSGMIDWAVYTFIARRSQKSQGTELDNGERIEVHAFDFNEFMRKVMADDFRDTEITCQILKLKERDQLDDLRRLLFA